jgi:hypothetical protein
MKNKQMEIAMVMMMHFGPCDMDRIETCEDCVDFKTGSCPGENRKGRACFDCMAEKVKSGSIQMGGSF